MKFLKRTFIIVCSLLLILYICGKIYSIPQPLVIRNIAADTTRIKNDLYFLTKECRFRNFMHPGQLNKAAEYIKQEFSKLGTTAFQGYTIDTASYKNVICSIGPPDAERVIIGAHYDACLDKEGADDNASGVCGLLELARLMKDKHPQYRIDFVAYANEEPPFFGTENMGSYVHAKFLHDSAIKVKGMISLEMIGMYSDEPHSQHYPVFFLKWFYGNKGNFITVAKKFFPGSFANYISKRMKKNQVIPTKSFSGPTWAGIDLSDHRNYWKFGYSAVMITNTAFYRNEYYHTSNDIAERLDIKRMSMVVDELYHTMLEMK